MGQLFRFKPAPMEYVPQDFEERPNATGLHFAWQRFSVVALRGAVLDFPFQDVVDIIVHEQTHAWQFEHLRALEAGA